MAHERGVLYGLVLYTARRVPYEKVDPAESRRLMIRDGLVTGEWPVDAYFPSTSTRQPSPHSPRHPVASAPRVLPMRSRQYDGMALYEDYT